MWKAVLVVSVPLFRDVVIDGRNQRVVDNAPELLGLTGLFREPLAPKLDGVAVDPAAARVLFYARVWIDDHAVLRVSGNDGGLLMSDEQILDRVSAALPSLAIHG